LRSRSSGDAGVLRDGVSSPAQCSREFGGKSLCSGRDTQPQGFWRSRRRTSRRHQGLSPRILGSSAGSETIALTSAQTGHTHTLVASSDAATLKTAAKDTSLATVAEGDTLYCNGAGTGQSATLGNSLSSVGVGLPHDNCAPTLAISAFICWAGIFPSQG